MRLTVQARFLRFLCLAFFASGGASCIFAQQGVITTIAGGIPNNVAAVSAHVDGPSSLAIDNKGNLCIVTNNAYAVFKVDGFGVLTIVAGTGINGTGNRGDGVPATSFPLGPMRGVLSDGLGNLFISDSFSNQVRRLDAVTGIITTVAGNGTFGSSGDGGPATSAELALPYGIAMDTLGNLFIADSGNNRIRRVDAATGVISTVAGNGASGFTGDGALATNATMNFSRTGGVGVAVDRAGNLFFTDGGNSRIRRVDALTGIISTVAGSGPTVPFSGGFSGDGGQPRQRS